MLLCSLRLFMQQHKSVKHERTWQALSLVTKYASIICEVYNVDYSCNSSISAGHASWRYCLTDKSHQCWACPTCVWVGILHSPWLVRFGIKWHFSTLLLRGKKYPARISSYREQKWEEIVLKHNVSNSELMAEPTACSQLGHDSRLFDFELWSHMDCDKMQKTQW